MQYFTIYNFNLVIIQTQKYLFFRKRINKLFLGENMISRTLFEARNVAGSAKYKQIKTVLNCVVLMFSLFILFIQA